MNQRTTGLVVGLVIFVILTVGLLASTIYFNIEAGDAKAKEAKTCDIDDGGGEHHAHGTGGHSDFGASAGVRGAEIKMRPEIALWAPRSGSTGERPGLWTAV